MPIQTYHCSAHGEFEVSVPFTEAVPPWQPCPARRGTLPVEFEIRSRSQGRRAAAQIGLCGLPAAWQPPTGVAFKIT